PILFSPIRPPPRPPLFPYTTLFRSPQRPQPAVLVVDGGDAARVGELDPRAHRVDVLVIGRLDVGVAEVPARLLAQDAGRLAALRSEEHTSELQSLAYLVCRLLLEKK